MLHSWLLCSPSSTPADKSGWFLAKFGWFGGSASLWQRKTAYQAIQFIFFIIHFEWSEIPNIIVQRVKNGFHILFLSGYSTYSSKIWTKSYHKQSMLKNGYLSILLNFLCLDMYPKFNISTSSAVFRCISIFRLAY